ncbi:MAG: EAL domain-containing protein, partial [Thermosynechococcaceae cyanobacterium]
AWRRGLMQLLHYGILSLNLPPYTFAFQPKPTYFLTRLYFSKKTNISRCPKCNHPVQRINRRSKDRFLAKYFCLSLERFKCTYYACHFEGLRVVSNSKNKKYNESIPTLFNTEKILMNSLRNNEICNYYQPKFDLDTNKVIGMEALMRWDHPTLGIINPSFFLEEVEKNKFIIDIGEFLIREVCDQIKILHEKDVIGLDTSVNLSRNQFYEKSLVRKISIILEEKKIIPNSLGFEINEKILIGNIDKSKNILYKLRDIGVNIAVDNFGLEKFSILHLKELPLTTLKIDRFWIQNLEQGSKQDIHILESFIALGKALNLRIVAMGVETNEQLNILRNLGCDTIQGFIVQPALNVEDSTAFLQKSWSKKNNLDKILSMT